MLLRAFLLFPALFGACSSASQAPSAPAPEAEKIRVEVIQLSYAEAGEVSDLLVDLMEDRAGFSVQVDKRRNAIVVAGTPDDLEFARDLAAKLDLPATG